MLKFNTKETGVWFISDTHYGHKNICKATTAWEDKEECRDFRSLEAMNQYIVDQINNKVGIDDQLSFLGDWAFGGIDNIWNFRSQILCKNIHFVLGNHDHHIELEHELPNCKRIEPYSSSIVSGKPLSGEYPDYVMGRDIFTTINHYLKIRVDGQEIVMSHYPMASWEHAYRGSWHLHGHCHGTLFANEKQWAGDGHWYYSSKILDVGIDSIFNLLGTYRPISFHEVRKIMNKRDLTFVDHHDTNTQG